MIISISSKLEPVLSFIYPNHTILPEGSPLIGKFIIHLDVTSPSQADMLKTYYPDGIFISNKIFDEVVTPERLKEMCIEFSKKHLNNRRTKFDVSEDTTPDEYVDFMFGVRSEDEEESVRELFDVAGSSAFVEKFISLSEKIPVPRLQAALNTFVVKCLGAREGSSVYYLRKSSVLNKKIRANMMRAVDDYLSRDDDSCLSVCRFYEQLFA